MQGSEAVGPLVYKNRQYGDKWTELSDGDDRGHADSYKVAQPGNIIRITDGDVADAKDDVSSDDSSSGTESRSMVASSLLPINPYRTP